MIIRDNKHPNDVEITCKDRVRGHALMDMLNKAEEDGTILL